MLDQRLIDDVVNRALALDLAFSTGGGERRQVPFALTPGAIDQSLFCELQQHASLLGRVTQAMSDDADLIQALHVPLAKGDPFFAELVSIHHELCAGDQNLPRVPLLLQRSDFMLDPHYGPRLVECNSIAAGMAAFGEQIQHLHDYTRERWPDEFCRFTPRSNEGPIPNHAIANFCQAVTVAAERIRAEHGGEGAPTLLMVVQENEDNVFDQYLLQRALEKNGVRTFRRTFRQLHEQLSSGPNGRLLLKDNGAIDVVYLRAGYQYRDYLAVDLDTRRCCDALRATRIFIERHRVAVNATVSQQLATSKRTQQYLCEASAESLRDRGLAPEDIVSLKTILAEMRSVDRSTLEWLEDEGVAADWVLKNQGEGGGHCLFDQQIIEQLKRLQTNDFAAWTLMKRLRPVARKTPTVLIREAGASVTEGLVSELGLFTAHYGSESLLKSIGASSGYLGYLVRSKPPGVNEGGIHSGFGVLDSLLFA